MKAWETFTVIYEPVFVSYVTPALEMHGLIAGGAGLVPSYESFSLQPSNPLIHASALTDDSREIKDTCHSLSP